MTARFVRLVLVAGFFAPAPAWVATAQTWERSSGPEGGVVNALAVLDRTTFAATQLGVYRSQDGGSSWSLTDPRLNNLVTALAVVGENLFAGTPDGVFRSEDGGASWIASSNGLTDRYILSFGIMGNRLFAGALSEVFYSDDLGSSWTEASAGLHGVFVRSFAFQNGAVFAALSSAAFPPPQPPGGGVYKSIDSGNSWIAASEGLGTFVSVYGLLTSGATLFAGTENGLFRSQDGATSWVASGLQGHFITVLVDTGQGMFAGTGDSGVFRSVDGGLTWSQTGLQGIEADALVVTDGLLLAGTTSGVFVSTDGGVSWRLEKSGMFNTNVSSLFPAFGTVFAVVQQESASRNALFASSDAGRSWSAAGAGLPEQIFGPGVVQGNAIYMGTSGFGVYKSVDQGHTWFPSNSGLSTLYVSPLGASETVLFLGSDLGLFRSMNGGSSWIRGQAGIPDYDFVHSFALADGAVYVGGNFGVYKSVDEGASWTQTGFTGGAKVVSGPGGEVFAIDSSGQLFRTRDGGASWTLMSSPSLSHVQIIVPVGKSLIAAATSSSGEGGVYISFDDGASWRSMNQGLIRASIADLVASGSELFAAVPGYGVQTMNLRAPLERLSAHPRTPHLIPQR